MEHLARLQTFYNQQAEIKLRLQNCFLEVSKQQDLIEPWNILTFFQPFLQRK